LPEGKNIDAATLIASAAIMVNINNSAVNVVAGEIKDY